MSNTVEAPESPVEGQTETPEGLGNREARYRVERNEARTALEAANARIEQFQRAEVERIAAGLLSHPEDLFSLSGNSVADYLDDEGNIDPEMVNRDLEAMVQERPGLRKLSQAHDPSQGLGGHRPPPAAPETHWAGFTKRAYS